MKLNLKDLQLKNCRGCRFANQDKVGTGEPCCTYPGMPRLEGDKCLTRKEQGITAQDVKTRLQTLDSALEKAQELTKGYDSAPKYVSHATHYIYVKLMDIRCTLDNLRAKIPDKFQNEREVMLENK